MEEWLRPKKKVEKKDRAVMAAAAENAVARRTAKARWQADAEAVTAAVASDRKVKLRTGVARANNDPLGPSEVPALIKVTTAAVMPSKGLTRKKMPTPSKPTKKAVVYTDGMDEDDEF
jgi:hypothetical protein